MNRLRLHSEIARQTVLTISLASSFVIFTPNAQAAVSFLGVAAGDATSTSAILWARAVDENAPANTSLTLEYSTAPLPPGAFNSVSAALSGVTQVPGACATDSSKDYVCKLKLDGLTPNTVYFYRFVGPAGETSIVGRFKTAPHSATSAPLHFAFSGDNDGLIRPIALASVIPSQNLDFYVNLGDVIYETASNLTTSGPHNGQPWLNSPSVTLSGSSLSLNDVPTYTGFATAAQLKADYE